MNHKTLLEAIGNTPLISLNLGTPAITLAKLDYLNPGGSIKDRSALYMIEEAEKNHLLKPGGTIIDASSGNQGIATAMIGAIKGYKVIITVSEKISVEKLKTIQAYGADVVICPTTNHLEDPESYHSKALELHKKIPNSFMPNQYFNQSNRQAHYLTLGPEIWKQTNGSITHLFAAAGTGGHVSGVGKYLKEKNENIKIIAMDALTSWHSTKGNPKPYKIEGLGIDFNSPVLDEKYIDDFIGVSDDEGLAILPELARKHGILVGPSSGAVVHAARKYSKNLSPQNVVVMILGDSGRAYLTKNFY